MGGDISTPQGAKNSSYFGTSQTQINEDNAMQTIRDIQIQRIEKRRGPPEPQKPRFKLMVSLSEFQIIEVEGIFILTFMVKTETSGRFVLIANGRMNSSTFYKTEEKVKYCIPLPDKTDFSLEISCSIDDYDGDIIRGVVLITKETFKFKLIQAGSVYNCQLMNQTLTTKHKNCVVDKNILFPISPEPRNDRCLFCLENVAQKSLCNDDNHKIICDLCKAAKDVKVFSCPLCAQSKTPQASYQAPSQNKPFVATAVGSPYQTAAQPQTNTAQLIQDQLFQTTPPPQTNTQTTQPPQQQPQQQVFQQPPQPQQQQQQQQPPKPQNQNSVQFDDLLQL